VGAEAGVGKQKEGMEMRHQCGVHGEGGCRSVPYRSDMAGKDLQVAGGRLTIHNNDYGNRSCVTSWSEERKWR
jgi:hypothetical protein